MKSTIATHSSGRRALGHASRPNADVHKSENTNVNSNAPDILAAEELRQTAAVTDLPASGVVSSGLAELGGIMKSKQKRADTAA
jgi:hypothetical protein